MKRPVAVCLTIAVGVLAADQLVKWQADAWLGPAADRHARWLIGNWLGLAYAENRGVAFGLLRNQPDGVLLAVALVVLGMVAAFVLSMRQSEWVTIGGGLVIGGAIGNALDRARIGYVRDFFAVGPWPAFNIADAAITCGVIVIALGIARGDEAAWAADGTRPPPRRRHMEWSE